MVAISVPRPGCCCSRYYSARAVQRFPTPTPPRNVILGVANTVAAVAFTFLAPVHWLAVIPLGVGCLLGSRLGPVVVRHAPAAALRLLIAAAGLALAIKLGIDAYV